MRSAKSPIQHLFFATALLLTITPAYAESEEPKDVFEKLLLQSPTETKKKLATLDEELIDLQPERSEMTPFKSFLRVARYERALSLEISGDLNHDNSKFVKVIACQFLLGKYQEAVATCEKWLSANESAPKSSIAFVYEFIGDCHAENYELQKAIDAFKKALMIDSSRRVDNNIEDLSDLLAVKNGKLSQKDHLQKKRINRRSSNSQVLKELHQLRSLRQRVPFIEIPLSSKFQGSGSSKAWDKASILTEKARTFDYANDFEQAAKIYKESLDLYKTDAATWSAYAFCMMMTLSDHEDEPIKIAEIKRALQRAVKSSPKDWRTWNNLGVYMMKEKEDRKAKSSFQTVLVFKDVPESQQKQLKENLQLLSLADKFESYFKNGKKWKFSKEVLK